MLLRSGSLAAWNSFIKVLEITLWRRSCDGRVVKALDLKSNGVSPRRFESCSQRPYLFWTFLRNKKHCIGVCWHQKRHKRQTGPWDKKIKNTTSFKISFPVSKSHYVLFQHSDSVSCDRFCKRRPLFFPPHIRHSYLGETITRAFRCHLNLACTLLLIGIFNHQLPILIFFGYFHDKSERSCGPIIHKVQF